MKQKEFFKLVTEIELIENELKNLDESRPVERYKIAFYHSELEYLRTQLMNFFQAEKELTSQPNLQNEAL